MRFLPALLIASATAALTAGAIWFGSARLTASDRHPEAWLEASLAKAIVEGRNVLFPAQVAEAELRWATAERLVVRPDVALLASSHGLQVSSSYTAPYSVSNFSISGGGFPDHLLTVEILRQKSLWPRVWAVFVDPWFFNPDLDFLMWKKRPHLLVAAEERLAQNNGRAAFPRIFRDRVASVVRPEPRQWYSLEPITATLDRMIDQQLSPIIETQPGDGLGTVLLADGSIQPIGGKRDITVEEARDLAIRQFAQNRDRHRYGTFSRVDEQLWTIFHAWLELLRTDGAEIVFILSPYHPAIFERIVADPKNHLREVESRLRKLAETEKIVIRGSYDPKQAGVPEHLFVDGDHLHEEGLRLILGSTFVDLAARTDSVPSPAP